MQREMAVMFDVEDDAQFGRACEVLAEALVHVNMAQLRSDAALPCCLGCGGVQYVPPQACPLPGSTGAARGIRPRRRRPVLNRSECQAVYDARGIYRHKRGTCFDLACERAARLRLKGEIARVVVEQVALMRQRKRARWDANAWRLHEPPTPPHPDGELHRVRVLSAVKNALDQLGASDRDIVVRRFFLDQDVAHVAADLGLQPAAVRARLSRALKRVRAILDEDFGGRAAWAGVLGLPWEPKTSTGAAVGWLALAGIALIVVVVLGVRWSSIEEIPPAELAADAPQRTASAPSSSAELGGSPSAPEHERRGDNAGDDPRNAAARALAGLTVSQDDGAPKVALSSKGASGDFKQLVAELRDTTRECLDALPANATGSLRLTVHAVAAADVGALFDRVEVSDDKVGEPEFTDCVIESVPAVHIAAPSSPLDQAFSLRINVERQTIALHGSLKIDDIDGYLDQMREFGAPESDLERQRERIEQADDHIIRTGWLSKYDPVESEETP